MDDYIDYFRESPFAKLFIYHLHRRPVAKDKTGRRIRQLALFELRRGVTESGGQM